MAKNTLTIKTVPKDVRATLLKEQSDHQIKCDCRFSLEKTAVMVIRKWGKIKDFRVNTVPVSKMVEEM